MKLNRRIILAGVIGTCCFASGCKVPAIVQREANKATPATYTGSGDTINMAGIKWRDFFSDTYLVSLIDTALKNNQELAITIQEVEIARNDIRFKHGKLFPTVEAAAGTGIEKVGRYTSQGAGDASTEIKPGKEVPEWLPGYEAGLFASWEVDIWKKLRTAKQAAVARYLSTVEGKNFVITNLVAEVADSYYELLALDNQLDIVKGTIDLQKKALEIVKVQKQAAVVTELAVKKFEAEVLNSESREYDILQMIKETENKINFLLARYPQPVLRTKTGFLLMQAKPVYAGIPSQLLINRPDIQQAELELAASRLDVKAARAEFYPSFTMSASLGLQAFNPAYLVKLPESLLATLAGDIAGPLVNKNAIKAEYYKANARQLQSVYNYEKTILSGYIEVSNELSAIANLQSKYELKSREVDTLVKSIDISNELFRSARADYFEVLMTQRDALEAKLELVETKMQQLVFVTRIYQSLGGGWN